MHDHRMTDGLAFGIERALHAQRTIMQAMHECGPLAVLREAEFEPGAPLRVRGGLRGGERGVVFVKRHADRRSGRCVTNA